MKVVHFHRRRRPTGNYSIEGFYSNVRNELKDRIDIEYVELPFYSNGIFRRFFNCIYAAFKQGDVNHVTGDVNYLNLFLKKNKTIVTILDCGLLESTNGLARKFYKYFWFTLPVKKSRYIVAISEATKNEILKYIDCDPDKINVIHVSVSPMYVKSEKDFNKTKPVILHIGTADNKNLIRHMRAVTGLSCKLVIIGELKDWFAQDLKARKIEFENFVNISEEELVQKYKDCDILFFASLYEGFGMPIVEANAVGRPVITSNILSMPEVAGDAALLVDPFNHTDIRNGIIKIINDDDFRNELVKIGYHNVKRFEINEISNKYYELYKSISN